MSLDLNEIENMELSYSAKEELMKVLREAKEEEKKEEEVRASEEIAFSDAPIASISDFKRDITQCIEMPGYDPDKPLKVRVQRISLTKMLTTGQISNQLLPVAERLFGLKNSPSKEVNSKDDLKNIHKIMEEIASCVLVEPSFEDLKEAGVELTDEQLQFLFSYGQSGVKSLKKFRKV